jgi:hypothetical protein
MAEDEIKRWKTLIDQINADITYYEMREVTADHDADAYAWGQSAHVLNNVLKKIHNIIMINLYDMEQEGMEKDIAGMEQGYESE